MKKRKVYAINLENGYANHVYAGNMFIYDEDGGHVCEYLYILDSIFNTQVRYPVNVGSTGGLLVLYNFSLIAWEMLGILV